MIFLLTTSAFLVFTLLFFFFSSSKPEGYDQAPGGGFSPFRTLLTALLLGAVASCALLTLLPPKGFDDLFLRYLGEEFNLAPGDEFIVGNDQDKGHFASRLSKLSGRLFILRNKEGSIWLEPKDVAYPLTIDGRKIDREVRLESNVSRASEEDREIVIEGRGRGQRARYVLRFLKRTARAEEEGVASFSLRFSLPVERPIRFSASRSEGADPRARFLLITNQLTPSAHDEMQFPISHRAGPVLAKLEEIKERKDAVRLVTAQDRFLLSVGSMARVGAFGSERTVLLQVIDRTFLNRFKVDGLLILLFVVNGLFLWQLLRRRSSPTAIAVYLIALFLLSMRFVLGVRVASLYPYQYEALSSAIAGLALLPFYVLGIRNIGPIAARLIATPGSLRTSGGRYQLWQYLKRTHDLWTLIVLTAICTLFLSFLPGSREGLGPDRILIAFGFVPLAFLVFSLLFRWMLGGAIFHGDLLKLRESRSLFAGLVEAEVITDSYWAKNYRVAIGALLVGVGLGACGLGFWGEFGAEDPGDFLRRPERLLAAGAALLVWGGVFLWWTRGRHGGASGRLLAKLESWLRKPKGFASVLRFWWQAPGGRLTAVVYFLVFAMIALGRRESLLPDPLPRIPLLLLYTFLFLAMATANMLFIVKKAGKENVAASMMVIVFTILPLGLYAQFGGDYGSVIILLFPILAVFSFAVMKRKATVALLSLTLFFLLVALPSAQILGGDYIRYRMASALLGHDVLTESATRTAQNTLEQIKQIRFYATSGDSWLTGLGYGKSPISPGLRNTALNDNVYSTLVLSEMGVFQGALLCLVYLLLLIVVLRRLLIPRAESQGSGGDLPGINRPALAQGSMVLGLCLSVVFIGIYMMAANVALVPLTGKNMPFLGMNSKSDLFLNLLVFGTMISALLGGLVTATTEDSKGKKWPPLRMEEGDRLRLPMLGAVGGITSLAALATALFVIYQWHDKPEEVVRFTTYYDKLEELTKLSNEHFRLARSGGHRAGEVPPLRLERNEEGQVVISPNPAVISKVFPDYAESYLPTHIREFRYPGSRSIFQVRTVDNTGDPERDYVLRVDRNYMNISSPFRTTGWVGEVLASPSPPLLSLEPLGKQRPVPVDKEFKFIDRPRLRLIPVDRQVLVERSDLQWAGNIQFKANGYDFKNSHPLRPPPKFLVLREDDFVLGPQGSYLVTHTSETKFSSVKRVNARLKRSFPQADSFFYAYPMAIRVGALVSEYELDPGTEKIRFTVDARLNRAIYDRVEAISEKGEVRTDDPRRVAVTVMDLASGELLALASAPAVDPNLGEDLPQYKQILFENHNLRKHPMGSAMKPFFAGAAVHAFPELATLQVAGDCGKIDTMFGFPFGSEISAKFGALTLEDFLAKSSNSYEFYLSILALSEADGEGSKRRIRRTSEAFKDCYQVSLGNQPLTRMPDFGGRISLSENGRETLVDKLDESPLAHSFAELFGIEYLSEQRSFLEDDLWSPLKDWLTALDATGEIAEKLEERLEIDASLPDLSMIPFDRLNHLRNDFLSTTIGGSEGRLHNVKIAESLARLATGKMLQARLMLPMGKAEEDSGAAGKGAAGKGAAGKGADGESADSGAEPKKKGLAATVAEKVAEKVTGAVPGKKNTALQESPDLPLKESLRKRLASGMEQVFSNGTGRPQTESQRRVMSVLKKNGLVILGKTGTHFDALPGRRTITDSMMIAVVGRGDGNRGDGERLEEGFVVVIYVADTVQNHATELLYELIPVIAQHNYYRQFGLER